MGQKLPFVWYSTETSVRDGIPSALACFEVAVAVTAYWAIAIHFETFAHLWISICVAPLLLLRSDESTALGVRWFDEFSRADERSPSPFSRPITSLTAAFAGLGLSVSVAHWLAFSGHSTAPGWSAFLWGVLGGVLVVQVVFITTGLFLGMGDGLAAGLITLGGTAVLSLLDAAYRFSVQLAGVSTACSVMLLIFLVGARRSWLAAGAFIPSVCIGVWLRSLLVRFSATVVFLIKGIWQIPRNFRDILFVVDILHRVQLVPGLDRLEVYTSDGVLRRIKNSTGLEKYFNIPIFVIFFVPANLYRLSIKSTFWLYLPLVYIVSKRDIAFSTAHLLDRLANSPWERLRRWLALITLVGFTLTVLAHNLTRLPEILSAKLVSPIEYLFLVDFPWKKPWQTFNLLSALITMYLWIQEGETRID